MKTIKINIYQYNELPEEAKEKARKWWIDSELEMPAWYEEHFNSMNAAIAATKKESDIAQLKDRSLKCEFTGYCADALLSDLIIKLGHIPSESEITVYYDNEWEKELNERILDTEYIEENIIINEYWFFSDGTIAYTVTNKVMSK